MTAVKICGITRRQDADAAVRFGAAYIGFVLWPNSPRAATLGIVRQVTATLPAEVTPVGVFVDPTSDDINAAADAGIRVAQVHGAAGADFSAARVPVIRAVHLAAGGEGIEPNIPDQLVLLDAHDPVKHGGTGKTVDWQRASRIAASRRVILAGGLTPANVRAAIEQVRPFAVDVASGVESSPGIKNHELIRTFIQSALGTFPQRGTVGT